MTDLLKDLTYTEFYMRENSFAHSPVENEMRFFECVAKGDVDGVKNSFTPLGSKGFGILSDDIIRNLKYHLIITIAFVTRFCVWGGMEHETAYNLSDLYIKLADKASSIDTINKIHFDMTNDFTGRMKRISKGNVCSKPVVQCFEYVYTHLCQQIKIKDIAEELKLSVPYLSKVFHAETGMTLSKYIMKKRIETACQMLKYTEYKATDIGIYLSFNSHSHFIKAFRETNGMTPKQYRNKYYHSNENFKVEAANLDSF